MSRPLALFFVAALGALAPCCAAFRVPSPPPFCALLNDLALLRVRVVVKGLVLAARVVLVRVACFSRVPQEWF